MSNDLTTYSAVLGVVLRNLRLERGIEQSDMAEQMGLSQASYSRLEGGKSSFTVDQMFQAANAIGIGAEELNQRLNGTISRLQASGLSVIPQVRGNATQAKSESNDLGNFLAGAGLAAALITLFSRK
ncbi:MAG TPA: helix-turn-helix transcriptional regulator [Kangiella sp.]